MSDSEWRDNIGRTSSQPEVCPPEFNLADPAEFARNHGFEPDDIQQRILRSQAKEIILLMARQTGKTTTIACKAAHLAVTQPGSQILIAGRVGRQSSELLRKTRRFLPKPAKTNSQEIVLGNGSRLVAIPGMEEKNVLGFSAIDMLIFDEAAFGSDALYGALRPMCATTNGTIILLSTPNGRNGFFYNAWRTRDDGWESYFLPASQCPRITAEFLERERRRITESEFQQYFECEFLDRQGCMFSAEMLENLTDPTVEALIL